MEFLQFKKKMVKIGINAKIKKNCESLNQRNFFLEFAINEEFSWKLKFMQNKSLNKETFHKIIFN